MPSQDFTSGRRWISGGTAILIAPSHAALTFLLPFCFSPNSYAISLDFSTSSQYSNNFVQVRNNGSAMAHNTGSGQDGQPGYVAGTHSNSISMWRYDTNAGDGVFTDTFLTDSVSLDLRVNTIFAANGGNSGIFTRIQDQAIDTGILALVSPRSTTSLQLRLFYGAQIDPANSATGTSFYDTTFDLTAGNTIATNTWWHLQFTQTLGSDADADLDADSVFNLTVSDPQGLVATTGNVVLTATDTFDLGGAIGTRFNVGTAGSVTSSVDNFGIVPEPRGVLLLAGGLLFLLKFRKLTE